MNEDSSNITFNIGIKPKTEAPKLKTVSSIFKTKGPTQPAPQPKIDPFPKKDKPATKITVTENGGDIKSTKESPFLKRLTMAKENIRPPSPVATETAFNSDTPINGFGKMCLLKQGWKPGLQIGKVQVPNEASTKLPHPNSDEGQTT